MAAVGLVVFGLSSIGDAVLAMDCSPTLSSSCRGLEGSGQLSTGHYLHTGTSVAAQAGIIASLAAARWAVRESAATAPRRLALLSVICAVEAVALIVMLGMIVAGMPGFGYPQVVMVVAASVWFAAVGFWLLGWSSGVGPVPAAPPRTLPSHPRRGGHRSNCTRVGLGPGQARRAARRRTCGDPDSSHLVMIDRPDLVAAAVRSVLAD